MERKTLLTYLILYSNVTIAFVITVFDVRCCWTMIFRSSSVEKHSTLFWMCSCIMTSRCWDLSEHSRS